MVPGNYGCHQTNTMSIQPCFSKASGSLPRREQEYERGLDGHFFILLPWPTFSPPDTFSLFAKCIPITLLSFESAVFFMIIKG